MSRFAKSALATVSGLALVFGLVSGATAQPTSSSHSHAKVATPVHHASSASATAKKAAKLAAQRAAAKKAAKLAAAKKAAAQKAAAQKAAKLAAAKKAAAQKAAKLAAQRAAAKKAAAQKAAKLAAQRAAAKKAAEARTKAARKALMSTILNAVTPDAPTDLPTDLPAPDPNQTDASDGSASGDVASMPIRCMAVYRDASSPCNWYVPVDSKPTAQQFAFNEALKAAYSDQLIANQAAYDVFETATTGARDSINDSLTKGDSEIQWMQVYLDYLVATHAAQADLNAATLVANQVFVDAKYAAIADFDAASYDATTETGAAALAALAEYRAASKALELEQFSKNLSDSTDLNEAMITRMQAYIDELSSFTSETDITAARDAYWTDLSNLYYSTAVASNEALQSFYEAVTTTEGAFVTLTGDQPSHPENYPWWYFGGDGGKVIIDPLPPVPGDGSDPTDDSHLSDCGGEPRGDTCIPAGETGGTDPVPGTCVDGATGDSSVLSPGTGGIDPVPGEEAPEIAVCPPYPVCRDYPRPLPPEVPAD